MGKGNIQQFFAVPGYSRPFGLREIATPAPAPPQKGAPRKRDNAASGIEPVPTHLVGKGTAIPESIVGLACSEDHQDP